MPGVLTEPRFITNPAEASLANSHRGEEAMARGLARGAGAYLVSRG